MARLLHRAALIACTAILLALGAASGTSAQDEEDTYWQGRRDAVWAHGINKFGDSNWYSKRPPQDGGPFQGTALDVPCKTKNPPVPCNGVAIFAQGAREYDIRIGDDAQGRRPEIREMLFPHNDEKYTFDVRTFFTIRGGGIRNNDITPPLFTIAAARSGSTIAGIIVDDALLQSRGDWPDARFRIRQGGQLIFQGNSRGGDAEVKNFGGEVRFEGFASAARMRITNRSQPSPFISRLSLTGNSTGGDGHFINQQRGQLNFGSTAGPGGNGSISAGKIENTGGALDLSTNTIRVGDSFTQEAEGTLSIHHDGSKHGRLIVGKDATLGGTLLATGFFRPSLVGPHTILRTEGRRIGKFDNETLNGGRLEYGPKTVVLVIGD